MFEVCVVSVARLNFITVNILTEKQQLGWILVSIGRWNVWDSQDGRKSRKRSIGGTIR